MNCDRDGIDRNVRTAASDRTSRSPTHSISSTGPGRRGQAKCVRRRNIALRHWKELDAIRRTACETISDVARCRILVDREWSSRRFHRSIRQLQPTVGRKRAVGLQLGARHISAEQLKIIAVLCDIGKRDAQDRLKQLGAKQVRPPSKQNRKNRSACVHGKVDHREFSLATIRSFLGSICPLLNTCFRL